MYKYFPYYVIDGIVNATSKYHMERKVMEPHLKLWQKKDFAPITYANIYHFITIIYYIGLCRLPCKADYWSTHPFMPKHRITTMLGMARDWFGFIWKHFHVQADTHIYQEASNEDEDDTENDDEDLIEQMMER
eukprot:13699548-Ditylum_brightwellii.AAC.1